MDARSKKHKQPKMKQKDYLDMIVQNQEQEFLERSYSFRKSHFTQELSEGALDTTHFPQTKYMNKNDVRSLGHQGKHMEISPFIDTSLSNSNFIKAGRESCKTRRVRRKPRESDPVLENNSLSYQTPPSSYENQLLNHQSLKPRSILKKASASSAKDFVQNKRRVYENEDLIYDQESFDFVSPRDIASRYDRSARSYSSPAPSVNTITSSVNSKVKIRTSQPLIQHKPPSIRVPLHREVASDFGTYITNKLSNMKLRKQNKNKNREKTDSNAHLLDIKRVNSPLLYLSKSENNLLFDRVGEMNSRRTHSYKMNPELYY